jgi:hypothetical protein
VRSVLLLALCLAGCPRPNPDPRTGCIPALDNSAPTVCAGEEPEPNDTMVLAIPPSSSPTCTGAAAGVLSSARDVDVLETGACSLSSRSPSVELSSKDALRLCLFPSCAYGTTNVVHCYANMISDGGAWGTKSEAGFPGCCRVGSGPVTVDVECGGIRSQAITGFIWVDAGQQSIGRCSPYRLTWRMN